MGGSLFLPDDLTRNWGRSRCIPIQPQEMYQGFFLAPHVVGQALKGAVFTAAMLEKLRDEFISEMEQQANRFNSIGTI